MLIIEDDQAIADFVARGLREAGFAVDRTATGDEGLAAAVARPYDVAIVDLMLPGRDGLSVIDGLRRRGSMMPVLGDRRRSQRGLGLGLSLVRAVVEAHRGRVSVNSVPRRGSTFTITLPMASASAGQTS